MAQIFEGNSSALSSTEDCINKTCLQCFGQAFMHYYMVSSRLNYIKIVTQNSQSLHDWYVYSLKQSHRHTILFPAAEQMLFSMYHYRLTFKENFFLAWEMCWFVFNVQGEQNTWRLAISDKYTMFGLQTSLTVVKCACHVTTNPKMPEKRLTDHRGRGSWGNAEYETSGMSTFIDMWSSNDRPAALGVCLVARKKKSAMRTIKLRQITPPSTWQLQIQQSNTFS